MIENLGGYGEITTLMKVAGGPEKFLQQMARDNQLKGLGVGAVGTGLLAVAGFYFYESHKQRQLAKELKKEQACSETAESVGESANSKVDEGNNASEIE
ncbi:hypothetical protein [Corynebacterium qintianiae]|uniref:hypothetical protein n=1 Tax=Corynebacterium qintianiae TaxID=2709392 RepID=UPI0013E9CF5B|nr:hypothetical protein [Corynebacterium qintianiae]